MRTQLVRLAALDRDEKLHRATPLHPDSRNLASGFSRVLSRNGGHLRPDPVRLPARARHLPLERQVFIVVKAGF
jgi:hypothetical protein